MTTKTKSPVVQVDDMTEDFVEDIVGELEDVARVTERDMQDLFSYSERMRYQIVKKVVYKTREYWEDRGRWAELVKEEYEDEEYFTLEALIKYYIEHIHRIDIVKHENHEEAMVAGKYYMELRDTKIQALIKTRTDRLIAERVKEMMKKTKQ
jgi:hypothetical protein